MHITIVGGGIAGLSAAWFIQQYRQQGGGDIDYTLLEAGPSLGGKLLTHQEGGCLLEAGPDSFITQKPWGLKLSTQLGLEGELIPCNQESSTVYVLRQGKLVAMPQGFRLTAPTQLWPFVTSPFMSIRGKLRVGMEPFIPGRTAREDESLAKFVRRRMGNEMLEGIAGPVMSGIFSADPEDLSMASTFPRFQELEWKYGSIIRGLLVEKRKRAAQAGSGAAPPMFMGFKNGMSTLSDALTDRLTGDLRTGFRVDHIERHERGGYSVYRADAEDVLHTDALVVALPADAASKVLKGVSAPLSNQLGAFTTTSTINVYLAFEADKVPHPQDGFGFVVPEREGRDIRSCTFSSTKFPGRAPQGIRLMRAFLSNARQRDMLEATDDEVVAVVGAEFKQLLGIDAEPVLQRVFRWPHANPQYAVGHLDRVRRVEESAAELPFLFLCGSAYGGVGVPDVIAGAHRAVERLKNSTGDF